MMIGLRLWKWGRRDRVGRDVESAIAPGPSEGRPNLIHAISQTEDNTGLKTLYDPTERKLEIEVDIICIHGIGGHREGTWTATEPQTGRTTLWIKDFLPTQLPNARIMTYGYSSQVFSIKHLTQRILYSHSKALLAALDSNRQDISATNRPVIFIAHSLGGLIVKSALIHANNDTVFKDILLSTAGMVFFGTPHQGAPDSKRSWINIVSDLVGHKIDCSRMRNTMESDLRWLQFQLEQYKSLDGWFPTHCLYEAEPSEPGSDASTVSQLSDQPSVLVLLTLYNQVIPRVAAIPFELLNTTTLSSSPRRQHHDDLCKWPRQDSEYHDAMEPLITMCEKSRNLVRKNVLVYRWGRELDPLGVKDDNEDDFRIAISLPRYRSMPFLGRDSELRALHDYLSTPEILTPATLLGPPGIGKTQIALEYAYTYQSHYRSIFWIDAQNRFTLHSSCLKCVEQLKNHYVGVSRGDDQLKALHGLQLGGLVDEEGRIQSCQDTPELLFSVLSEWLKRKGNSGWLLILDGVARESDLRKFHIDKFLDSPTNGRIVVTSQSFHRGEKFIIHELEQDDAVRLLRYTSELKEISDDKACELVDQLGRLPLAIQQAVAFLSRTEWSIDRYSQSLLMNTQKSKTDPHFKHAPVLATWQVSLQHLDENSAELLDTVAFLSDNDVSVDFIKNRILQSQSSARTFVMDESLRVLKNHSLIRHNSATQMITVNHSALNKFLRETKENTTEDYISRAKMACSSVSSYLRSSIDDENSITYTAKQFRLEEELLPCMERCVDYIKVLSPEEADWRTLGDVCRRQGRHDLARRFYDVIVIDHQEMPLQAELLLQDLHDMEYSLGPTHIRTLGSAVLLASRYQEEGEHAKAEVIWRRANSSQSRALGDYHPLTLKTAARLALTLQQQGKYSQAKAIYSSTSTATAMVLGDKNPETLMLMANVAMMYTLERRFDEADQEYKRVLEKMKEVLGPDHVHVRKIQRYMILNNQRRPNVEGVSGDILLDGF
ncbi:hypothetical protein NPX13_g347 [Xylaria arbuscula]|uniref:Uncharacterized protein n=1 Tax=Xylaria arbuscula TaxID=114810 RepID=A0A9W8NNZ5_9PEZI|nr:hypothetical protein NPX13_g347 [Xylaria arbuscula]